MRARRWFHYTLVDADLAINSMMWCVLAWSPLACLPPAYQLVRTCGVSVCDCLCVFFLDQKLACLCRAQA